MIRLVVVIPQQFDDILVERIVETLTGSYGKPCVTPLHLPLQTYRLGLFPEGFALGSMLHLKKNALLHQQLYGTVVVHNCKVREKKQKKLLLMRNIISLC